MALKYTGHPIAVLGGGNGGHCMAADLTLAGQAVHWCELPELAGGKFAPVLEKGTVSLTGIGRTGTVRPALITTDMATALEGSKLINLAIPAFGHGRFYAEMIPHLQDGQVVVVWAGDFGAIELYTRLRRDRPGLKVDVVEANTLPYGTRLTGPAEVELILSAPLVTAAAVPAARNAEVLPGISELWPCVRATQNALSAAFSNPNPIVHPPGSLLNVGRIQYSEGDFYMYGEGITEAVARVIRDVYDEMAGIAALYGSEVLQYEDRDFRTTVSIMGVAFQAPFDTVGEIARIIGPKTIYDRYITEDLPMGLVPAAQLARLAGKPAHLVEAIIYLGSSVCGMDFWKEGRTLEKLGLAGMTVEDIVNLVSG
ncbi:MAG: NAD/NADP octopine/nopaline dehydrogenase family protein [Bacillota bacterium]|nr:NAD/NADP octopine/nopaline dehydrogenase family protein [Bacillota bacterium]